MGVLLLKQKVKRCTATLAAVGYMYCGGHGWDEVMGTPFSGTDLKAVPCSAGCRYTDEGMVRWSSVEGCTMLCWLQVHRRGHGWDGVHWGRIQHEWSCFRVPAVSRCYRWVEGRIRRVGSRMIKIFFIINELWKYSRYCNDN